MSFAFICIVMPDGSIFPFIPERDCSVERGNVPWNKKNICQRAYFLKIKENSLFKEVLSPDVSCFSFLVFVLRQTRKNSFLDYERFIE